MEYIVFLVCAYIAAAIATIAGFGSSTLLIPVAFQFFEPKIAIFIVACFHLFNNLFKVHLFFKKIDFRVFLYFGIPSIALAFIGARVLADISIPMLKKIVGGFLIVFALYSMWKPHIKIRQMWLNSLIGGGLSGFLAGLIGMGGAIRSAFLITFNMPKEIYIATAALIAFVIDCTRIPTYIASGVVNDASIYRFLPILFVIAYIGVLTGKRLLTNFKQESFRRFVLIALLLVGIKILIF